MAINIALKTAFLAGNVTQTEVARETGIHESRLSRIVRGWQEPTPAEKRLLARALRRPVDDLFHEAVA